MHPLRKNKMKQLSCLVFIVPSYMYKYYSFIGLTRVLYSHFELQSFN